MKENYLVLIADDSEDDRFLLKTAMKRASRLRIVGEVVNGSEAIAYLKGEHHFGDREKFPLPDLLLLDLKMPLQGGFEVLEWLQAQSFLDIKVVVLTDSMRAEHIKHALDLGADLFQVKPTATQEREAMVLALEEHMHRGAEAPRTPHSRHATT